MTDVVLLITCYYTVLAYIIDQLCAKVTLLPCNSFACCSWFTLDIVTQLL